jgi:hypothetical protein
MSCFKASFNTLLEGDSSVWPVKPKEFLECCARSFAERGSKWMCTELTGHRNHSGTLCRAVVGRCNRPGNRHKYSVHWFRHAGRLRASTRGSGLSNGLGRESSAFSANLDGNITTSIPALVQFCILIGQVQDPSVIPGLPHDL